jgi:hypothetical protein
MATEWIKMRRGLRHDPKVIAMSRYLYDDPDFMRWWQNHDENVTSHVCVTSRVTERVTFANVTRVTVCALLDVWSALNGSISSDGKASFLCLQDIDKIAEIPCIGSAMKLVGWVIENNDGSLMFPNFHEHNSTVKDREKVAKTAAERAKEYRDRKREKETVTASRHVTLDKIRLDKSIKRVSNDTLLSEKSNETKNLIESVWMDFPSQARERSSKTKFADEWQKIPKDRKPSIETLKSAIQGWSQSQKWISGYAEGVHLWLKNFQWENVPESMSDAKKGASMQDLIGGRKRDVIDLTETEELITNQNTHQHDERTTTH